MNNICYLSSLSPGERARICNLNHAANLYPRLLDIGLIENTIIECLGRSPTGDPSAFLIRGAVIAIRRDDCEQIRIEPLPSHTFVVALIGNPNVGKSTIFNGLTGRNQHTGNWPGKTVTQAFGYVHTDKNSYQIFDLPGTYSLFSQSPEEEITCHYLSTARPDLVIVICDATCLERNLILSLQVKDRAPNMILCINLLDEATKKGITIDIPLLSELVALPVIGITAHKKTDIKKLQHFIQEILESSPASLPPDKPTPNERTIKDYITKSEAICKKVLNQSHATTTSIDYKIDRVLTNKFIAFPIMFLLLLGIFWLTIKGANYPSQLLSSLFFYMQNQLSNLLLFFHTPYWLHDVLILGIYRVLAWVIAVMLPPMAIFFPLFTLLEDIGYLPRVAYNLDRPFKCCNACGKQALCMCMGFGCNAVGVTGCRIIQSPRERLLAILTNALVPCNGRFPTLVALITMFFISSSATANSTLQASLILTAFITLSIIMTFLCTKLLSCTLLKGTPSSFVLELPPYRRPQLSNILIRSLLDRTLFILGRAIVVAAPAGLLIWLLANLHINGISIFQHIAIFFDPFAAFIGLDGIILLAFILGLPANEIVIPLIIMGYLAEGSILELSNLTELKLLFVENGWTTTTAICVMLFSLFHWPCSTTLLTIRKETNSMKWTFVSALLPTIIGCSLCATVHYFMT